MHASPHRRARASHAQAGHALAALIVAAALGGDPGAARAHAGGAATPEVTPPAPPGDGQTAERLLREIGDRADKDEKKAQVVAEPVKRAKSALERAHGARVSGDAPHARMLEGLALEWAEAARDLERAAAAEAIGLASAKKARDASTQVERARALLEETQARRARAAAEVERLDAEAKGAAKAAAGVEDQRIEAAKGGGKGAAPASKKPADGEKKQPAPGAKKPAKKGAK